jgi:SAM-dependent methyltransferase
LQTDAGTDGDRSSPASRPKALALGYRRPVSGLPLPPEQLRRVGQAKGRRGEFQEIGEDLVELMTRSGLRPEHRVLDVGSGIGRVAAPMTSYLTTGSYEGFDVDREMVEWCQQNITPAFPNFRFQVADLYNPAYNPTGAHRAESYRFPYEDESFDFVLLTSVFTHMPPGEVDHYLSEISRVLVPGGIAFITWFLIDRDSKRILLDPETFPQFRFERRHHRIANPDKPTAAVAHDARNVRAMYRRNGLQIRQIHPGKWRGLDTTRGDASRQDLILATNDRGGAGPHSRRAWRRLLPYT